MQEINRLNEVIANKNEELEVIRQLMEIQDQLMRIIVEDIRNPSQVINNSLNSAQNLFNRQLGDISNELQNSFNIYQ